MSSPTDGKTGLRHMLRHRLNPLRTDLRSPFHRRSVHSAPSAPESNSLEPNTVTTPQPSTYPLTEGSRPLQQTRNGLTDASRADHGMEQHQADESTHTVLAEQSIHTSSSVVRHQDSVALSQDLWSRAYREAVESLGGEIDVAILQGRNIQQLFEDLKKVKSDTTQESAFHKGLQYLRSIQVPLERFKLVLDLASPLTSLDPAASTAFGVVRGVTAVAISLSSADLDFATQIAEMLKLIAYIDGCDTLGQKVDKMDIHEALVSVYKKLIEFYQAAFQLLSQGGARLAMSLLLQDSPLPSIVKDFLKEAHYLEKLIFKATCEIADDIKAMLYDEKIDMWLGASSMTLQSQHHINQRHLLADEACQFLLADTTLLEWYHSSVSKQLVLLGEMGSGKTVAMAFLIDELSRRSEQLLPQPKICYYYCRDNATGDAVQIMSCLVLSILRQLPGLKKGFYEWYKRALTSGSSEPATDPKRLEEFLLTSLANIDRPVFFIIDGLDECKRDSRQILLRSMSTVSQKTGKVKTIFSSRPQEEILDQLNGIPEVSLRHSVKRDAIIVQKTVDGSLYDLSDNVKALIVSRLSCMAQGSAIWTKMICKLIEIRKIRAFGPMQLFLSNPPLPGELSQLYTTLFSRCTSDDPENENLASLALRTLAIARRPLSILELSWASILGSAPEELSTIASLSNLIDHQRVLSLIHPFITRPDFSKIESRQIQLVHQSVKEFILGGPAGWPPLETAASSVPLMHATPTSQVESLERLLLNICMRYLQLEEVGATHLFSEEQVAIEALPQNADLFSDDLLLAEDSLNCSGEAYDKDMIRYDPTERGLGDFFVYASSYWTQHFSAVTNQPLPTLPSVENLCQAGSTRLANWIEQNRRPDCTIKPRFEFDSSLYDPLGITALYGSEAMFQEMLVKSDFAETKFLPDSIMEAANQILQWGEISRLKILLESPRGCQLLNLDFFRLLITRRSSRVAPTDDWDLAFDLVYHVLTSMVQEQWGNDLLCVATRAGCTPLVQRIVAGAQHDTNLKNELLRGVHESPNQDALRIAVKVGDLDMCRLLVSTGGMDPSSAITYDEHSNMVLKDQTHQNRHNGRAILEFLCDNMDKGKKA